MALINVKFQHIQIETHRKPTWILLSTAVESVQNLPLFHHLIPNKIVSATKRTRQPGNRVHSKLRCTHKNEKCTTTREDETDDGSIKETRRASLRKMGLISIPNIYHRVEDKRARTEKKKKEMGPEQ